jgi:Ankyrin repeats (3 copies)
MMDDELEYLKYLNGRGLCIGEYDRHCLWNCAKNGHLNVLKYCQEHINSITEYDCILDEAAYYGHLDLVKYLHSIGSKCTKWAMDWSALDGYLEVVQFLHFDRQEGCTQNAMNWAAEKGHLDVVKFLYHNRIEGIPEQALDYARRSGEQNVVDFLKSVIESDVEKE